MTLVPKTYLRAACDDCGECASPGHPFEAYELNEADLLESIEIDGWMTTSARHICPRCRVRRACRIFGHQWVPWKWARNPYNRCHRCGDREPGTSL